MSEFKTVATYEYDGSDIIQELQNSLSYLKLQYCYPWPSEFFKSFDELLSNDLRYLEVHVTFENYEKYEEWFSIFGELNDELILEMLEELKKASIVYKRYFPDFDSALSNVNIYQLTDFESKLTDIQSS